MGSHDDVPTAATRTPARMSPSLTARHSCATAASDAIGRPAVSSVHGLKHAGWRGTHVGARTLLARVGSTPSTNHAASSKAATARAVRRSHVRPVTNASRGAPRTAIPPAWRFYPARGIPNQTCSGSSADAYRGLAYDEVRHAEAAFLPTRARSGKGDRGMANCRPPRRRSQMLAFPRAGSLSGLRGAGGDTLSSSSRASPRQGARTRRLRHRVILLGLLTGRGRARRTRRKASAEARSASTASNQDGHAS